MGMPQPSHKPRRPWLMSISVAAGALLIGLGVVILRPSQQLAINRGCSVDGWVDNLRAIVQGGGFWNSQLDMLDSEIARLEAFPDKLASMDQMMQEIELKARASIDELHTQYPNLRPSAASEAADMLRRRADAIEAAEFSRIMIDAQRERIGELVACRPIVAARGAGYQLQPPLQPD